MSHSGRCSRCSGQGEGTGPGCRNTTCCHDVCNYWQALCGKVIKGINHLAFTTPFSCVRHNDHSLFRTWTEYTGVHMSFNTYQTSIVMDWCGFQRKKREASTRSALMGLSESIISAAVLLHLILFKLPLTLNAVQQYRTLSLLTAFQTLQYLIPSSYNLIIETRALIVVTKLTAPESTQAL